MKRDPYPATTHPEDDLSVGYFLANAERTANLCRELGYAADSGHTARPPKGKRGPHKPPEEKVIQFLALKPIAPTPEPPPSERVQAFTDHLNREAAYIESHPPPLPPTPTERNLPKSDSSGAGAP